MTLLGLLDYILTAVFRRKRPTAMTPTDGELGNARPVFDITKPLWVWSAMLMRGGYHRLHGNGKGATVAFSALLEFSRLPWPGASPKKPWALLSGYPGPMQSKVSSCRAWRLKGLSQKPKKVLLTLPNRGVEPRARRISQKLESDECYRYTSSEVIWVGRCSALTTKTTAISKSEPPF